MRFPQTKIGGAVFIAIFQTRETGRVVLRNLRRDGFGRSALLHSSASGKLRESGVSAIRETMASAIIGLLIGTVLLWRAWLRIGPIPKAEIALVSAGFALGGALVGWFACRILGKRPSAVGRARFKRSI